MAVLLAGGSLSGCSSQRGAILTDDDALCRYSEMADGTKSYTECRKKLESQRSRVSALNASRTDGVALLKTPQANDVAGRCKTTTDAKDCPADDLTGTIPLSRKP